MADKLYKRRVIFGILAVVVMVTIFCFSSRDADKSSEDSLKAGLVVGKVLVKNFDKLSEEKQLEYAERIDHPVRKTAHFLEYTILGFLLLGTFVGKDTVKILPAAAAWVMGTFYAGTDEFHQRFTSGRSGQLSDVLLDSSGVFTGVLLAVLIFLIIFHMRNNKETQLQFKKQISER